MSSVEFELVAGAQAFGDGQHPSTRGAMQAISQLKSYDLKNILDLGCGSGILIMQAAQYWPVAQLTAADLQTSAVETTKANLAHNGLAERVTVRQSEGFKDLVVRERAPYDLVVSNMLAEILYPLASLMAWHLSRGGLAVLSGVLHWQAEDIIKVYEQVDMKLLDQVAVDDWRTLTLQKAA